MSKYTILLIPDTEEGGYAVDVPALPEVHTQGDTVEEAMANAREAIELYLEYLKDQGEPLPTETEKPLTVEIEVAA